MAGGFQGEYQGWTSLVIMTVRELPVSGEGGCVDGEAVGSTGGLRVCLIRKCLPGKSQGERKLAGYQSMESQKSQTRLSD